MILYYACTPHNLCLHSQTGKTGLGTGLTSMTSRSGSSTNLHRVSSTPRTASHPSTSMSRPKRDTGVREAATSLVGRTQEKGRGEGGGGGERGKMGDGDAGDFGRVGGGAQGKREKERGGGGGRRKMGDGDGDFGRGGKVGGSAQGKGGGERSRSSVKEDACEERRASQTRGNSESKSAIVTRLEKEVLVSVSFLNLVAMATRSS